jgi:hypothetical protein
MPIWKAAGVSALSTLGIAWVIVTGFTVLRQHERVSCYYDQTGKYWQECTQNTALEEVVKSAYQTLGIDL